MMTFALYAEVGIDDIDVITFGNCFHGAFRFAGSAGGAVIIDDHCHGSIP